MLQCFKPWKAETRKTYNYSRLGWPICWLRNHFGLGVKIAHFSWLGARYKSTPAGSLWSPKDYGTLPFDGFLGKRFWKTEKFYRPTQSKVNFPIYENVNIDSQDNWQVSPTFSHLTVSR